MIKKTIKQFLKEPEKLIHDAIVNDDFVAIKTDEGYAVLINEVEWNALRGSFQAAVDLMSHEEYAFR